jgi:hypothetical protein
MRFMRDRTADLPLCSLPGLNSDQSQTTKSLGSTWCDGANMPRVRQSKVGLPTRCRSVRPRHEASRRIAELEIAALGVQFVTVPATLCLTRTREILQ